MRGMRVVCELCEYSGLTSFIFLLFSSFFYSLAFKATTLPTTAAVHVSESMASTRPKNKPTMNPSTTDPSSPSPVPSTVTNASKEDNRGGDGPCETIKMATKEEKNLGIVLTKDDDDDKRRSKISTNETDATTKVENHAAAKWYEQIGEGVVL